MLTLRQFDFKQKKIERQYVSIVKQTFPDSIVKNIMLRNG